MFANQNEKPMPNTWLVGYPDQNEQCLAHMNHCPVGYPDQNEQCLAYMNHCPVGYPDQNELC